MRILLENHPDNSKYPYPVHSTITRILLCERNRGKSKDRVLDAMRRLKIEQDEFQSCWNELMDEQVIEIVGEYYRINPEQLEEGSDPE